MFTHGLDQVNPSCDQAWPPQGTPAGQLPENGTQGDVSVRLPCNTGPVLESQVRCRHWEVYEANVHAKGN